MGRIDGQKTKKYARTVKDIMAFIATKTGRDTDFGLKQITVCLIRAHSESTLVRSGHPAV